jgi:GT2 family glycosyltransferase
MLSISAVIPTLNRGGSLAATLESLLAQSLLPQEIVVVDGSDASTRDRTRALLAPLLRDHSERLRVVAAVQIGAAAQRNQGVAATAGDLVLFLDDDMHMDRDCLERLAAPLTADAAIGGACGLIENHCYHPPGLFSRMLFAWLNGVQAPSYAGRCLGPAFTTLPEDGAHVPEIAAVDWMLTGCALYRRAALPIPPVPPRFTGASIAEDLALSLSVARSWQLFSVRQARLRHEEPPKATSQCAEASLAEMEMMNRHFIMTQILGRSSLRDYGQYLTVNLFMLPLTLAQHDGLRLFPARLLGRVRALWKLLSIGATRSCLA